MNTEMYGRYDLVTILALFGGILGLLNNISSKIVGYVTDLSGDKSMME